MPLGGSIGLEKYERHRLKSMKIIIFFPQSKNTVVADP